MENWDYKYNNFEDEFMRDMWAQTLVTAFNSVALENNFFHKSKIEVIVPEKFRKLIESLIFYNNGVVGDKYYTEFVDEDCDFITLEGCELKILNYEIL
jgi:hypothetical protein